MEVKVRGRYIVVGTSLIPKVSNVSKLANKNALRSLFSILGNILVFEHYPKYVLLFTFNVTVSSVV